MDHQLHDLIVDAARDLDEVGAFDGSLHINHGGNGGEIELPRHVNLHQLHTLDVDHLGVEAIFFQQPGFLGSEELIKSRTR
jgi:hypothetical protein